jgi:hypothetical protein
VHRNHTTTAAAARADAKTMLDKLSSTVGDDGGSGGDGGGDGDGKRGGGDGGRGSSGADGDVTATAAQSQSPPLSSDADVGADVASAAVAFAAARGAFVRRCGAALSVAAGVATPPLTGMLCLHTNLDMPNATIIDDAIDDDDDDDCGGGDGATNEGAMTTPLKKKKRKGLNFLDIAAAARAAAGVRGRGGSNAAKDPANAAAALTSQLPTRFVHLEFNGLSLHLPHGFDGVRDGITDDDDDDAHLYASIGGKIGYCK